MFRTDCCAALWASSSEAPSARKLIWSLDDQTKLLPAIEMLAKQHVHYGVQPAHYATLGQALMWTLEHRLDRDWTDATTAAWARAYGMLSRHMIEHACGAKNRDNPE